LNSLGVQTTLGFEENIPQLVSRYFILRKNNYKTQEPRFANNAMRRLLCL